MRTLLDCFENMKKPSPIGIFNYLGLLDVPWKDDINSQSLDIIYFFNRSGGKYASPMTDYMKSNRPPVEFGGGFDEDMANLVHSLYATQWNKTYKLLKLEYDPIANYDMTENENIDNDGTVTGTNSNTRTGSDTHTKTDQISESDSYIGNATSSRVSDVYGFNSTTSVHADSDSDTGTSNTTTTHTGDNTTTDSANTSLVDSGESSSTTENNTVRTLTRKGNIGVTTTAQLIGQEIELWKWNFIEGVFKNLDDVLTLKVY